MFVCKYSLCRSDSRVQRDSIVDRWVITDHIRVYLFGGIYFDVAQARALVAQKKVSTKVGR